MIAHQNCTSVAGRSLNGNAKSILVGVSGIAGRLRVVDAFISFTAAPRGANRSTQHTSLAVKLCAGRATFDMSRAMVGRGNDVVEGVLSMGWRFAKDILLGSGERKRQADSPGCVKPRHDSFCRLGLVGKAI